MESAKKRKQKQDNKEAWKNHDEKYTAAKMDDGPVYMTKPRFKAGLTPYPQEIQEELRTLAANGGSQQMEYDMTNGWVYTLRLIAEPEREKWEKYLAKFHVDWVGAQWGKNNTNASPPDTFDDVQYRPIYLKEAASM